MDYQTQYKRYQDIFEKYLLETINGLTSHEKLVDAMKYSLLAGGKRVRPVLMLATTEMLGGSIEKALPFALAVECIHTYSLIHDDLPAMDNDDLRRGKPTNHKVFGEDFAILAGDALQGLAFEICLKNCKDERDIKATYCLAECAGFSGMICGQAHDIDPILGGGEEQLLQTEINKTSKLIIAPLKMAGILFGGDCNALQGFGEKLGLIYQFVDDLLDAVGDASLVGKAVGKDAEQNKVNAIKVYGIDGTRKQIEKLVSHAEKLISNIKNNEFLLTFLHLSTKRVF